MRWETRQAAFSPHTLQLLGGNIALSPLLSNKKSNQRQKIAVRNREMLMVTWSSAWPWEWWRWKLGNTQAAGPLHWVGLRSDADVE